MEKPGKGLPYASEIMQTHINPPGRLFLVCGISLSANPAPGENIVQVVAIILMGICVK